MLLQTEINFKSYHNTTSLSGFQLESSIKTADKQDAVILKIFYEAGYALSPSEVLNYCEIKGYKYLITSVRRTISNLTEKGDLIKTELQKMGPHGKPEGLWIYWDVKN